MTADRDDNRLVRWLVANAIENPWRAIAAWSLLALASMAGTLLVRVETSTESVLDRSGGEWQFYLQSTELFGSDEDIVVAIPGEHAFDEAALSELRHLAVELAVLPGVRRVDSLATTPLVLRSPTGDLRFSPPFADELPSDQVGELGRQVLASEGARGLLVSQDGMTFALRLRLDDPLGLNVQRLTAEIRQTIGERRAWVSGVPVFRAETGAYTQREIRNLVPLTIVVVGLMLALFFSSFRVVPLALAIGGTGTFVALGVMGVLGISLSLTAAILPSILLAIGCANTIHLLAEVGSREEPQAFEARVVEVARPILMAGVVTALAFLSGAVVPIEAIRVVAAFGALGALVLAFCTVHLGTAALRLWHIPRREHRQSPWAATGSERLVKLAARRPWSVVGAWTLLVLLAAVGVRNVELETDVTNWFPRDGTVRQSYDAISARLAGISPLNIVVAPGEGSKVTDPNVVRAMDELARFLEELPDVGRALSVGSLLRDIHGGMHPASKGELPNDLGLIEQYLLLLESSDELREFVTSDRAFGNVSIRANNNGSERLLAIAEQAEDWWTQNGTSGSTARATGIMFEFARAEREITTGQLGGLGLDLVALLCLYWLLFRSIGITAIAVLPTFATIFLTFGALGWAGAALDAGTVFVGTLAVGVTVDETVHMVSAYAQAAKRQGDWEGALRSALQRILPALLMTTSALAGGFLVLGASSFAFTRQLGVATAIAMIVCAAANATLLPALLALRAR